jgi:gamma-glutamylcyclotransferase (GGCT)/AIG2-like uncharacterized protein YtfP
MNNYLFTYGTLKKGHFRHNVLEMYESKFLYEGWTERGDFILHRTHHGRDSFPVPLQSEKGHPIYGEVYEISEHLLPVLDRIEAIGHLYNRELLRIRPNANGRVVQAWTYVGIPEAWRENRTGMSFPICRIIKNPGKCFLFD